MNKKADEFDYEGKMWGSGEVNLDPKFLGATRLRYVLKALKPLKTGNLLEIGCGGGTCSIIASKSCFTFVPSLAEIFKISASPKIFLNKLIIFNTSKRRA